MPKGIVDVEEYESATELRRRHLRHLRHRHCLLCILFAIRESPNMAIRELVYGPELEENAGVVLGGVVDIDGTTGAAMGLPRGGDMGRYGIGWNG